MTAFSFSAARRAFSFLALESALSISIFMLSAIFFFASAAVLFSPCFLPFRTPAPYSDIAPIKNPSNSAMSATAPIASICSFVKPPTISFNVSIKDALKRISIVSTSEFRQIHALFDFCENDNEDDEQNERGSAHHE